MPANHHESERNALDQPAVLRNFMSCGEHLHRQPPSILVVFLIVAVAALYLVTLKGEWLFDDYNDVLGPEAISRLWPLKAHLYSVIDGQIRTLPRPLGSISFALNFAVGGHAPFSFHAVNIAIHALSAISLFELVRRTLQRLPDLRNVQEANFYAFLIALFWAIHPLQTEAVSYITQRYESLAGFFIFLTLLSTVRSLENRRKGWWEAAAAISCLLALMSKEVAVSVPLLVLLFDRAFLTGSFSSAWRARRRLYVALGFAWCLFLWNQLHVGDRPFAGAAVPSPWWEYMLNQPAVILHYLRLVIWPHPLILDYGWVPATSLISLLPGYLLIGSLLAATLVAHFRAPRVGFLGLFFFLILAPTSSIMPLLDPAVEHRMYTPLAAVSIGLVIGGRLLFKHLEHRHSPLLIRRSFFWISAGIIVVFGCLTYVRNLDYQTAIRMGQATVAQRPGHWRAHINLAFAYDKAGRLDDAVSESKLAATLAPDRSLLRTTLAVFLDRQGQRDQAIEQLQVACRLDPTDPRPLMMLGEMWTLADPDEAVACFRKALTLDPRRRDLRYLMGNVLAVKGLYREALHSYRQEMLIQPQSSLLHQQAAKMLIELGRLPEALSELDLSITQEARTEVGMTQVGRILYARRRYWEAIAYWERALTQNPRYLPALLQMSWALSTNPLPQLRDGVRATALAETLLALNTNREPAALEALASAYAESGRLAEASVVMEQALRRWEMSVPSRDLSLLKARLALFRAGKPYREEPMKIPY